MWEYDLAEMVAVTAERTYYLKRPVEGFFLDPGEISQEYDLALAAVRRRLDAAAALGLITVEESMSRGRWADGVMDILGMFYDYRWTEVER